MAKDDKKATPAIGNSEILAEINLIQQVQQIETKLAYQPNSVRFAQLADAYLGIGQYDEAIKTLEEGLTQFPNYATANLILAKAHTMRGDKKRAQTLIQEFLQGHPAHVAAHKMLGDLALEEDDVITAVSKYRVALRYDPINRQLIQTLVDLKDQYQKVKATRTEEEEDEAPKPAVLRPAAKVQEAVAKPKPVVEAAIQDVSPAKDEMAIPTEMVEDMIVKEMTIPSAEKPKPVLTQKLPEIKLPEKIEEKSGLDEVVMMKPAAIVPEPGSVVPPASVDESLTSSAAWVDSDGILYFYDDDEVSFVEYKARLDLKKAGRAMIMGRAQLDAKIAAAGGTKKPQAKSELPAQAALPKEPVKKDIPKKEEARKEIPIAEFKKAETKKPEASKTDTGEFRHETHKDDTLHRHVDSAFGSGEDTGVFMTPDQEKTFFADQQEGSEDVLSEAEQEAALEEIELSYKDYLDILVDERDLEEAIFKDEEPSDAVDEELSPITQRLARVTEEAGFVPEAEDSPISYRDYLESCDDAAELREATLEGDDALMSFGEISAWLDISDEEIDYAVFKLFEPHAVVSGKAVKATKVTADEGEAMNYKEFMAQDSDGEKLLSYKEYEAGLEDDASRAEAQLEPTEAIEPVITPEVKAVPAAIVEPVKEEIVVPEPAKVEKPVEKIAPSPVIKEEIKPVAAKVVEPAAPADSEDEAEAYETTEEEINPQDATMELVDRYATMGQYGMAYKICKMLKMKNPTDAKVDRKVLELKRMYLWSSQLVG